MKRILIITEVFPPAFNPRIGYLVRHLSEYGWDAHIITKNTVKENNFNYLVGDNKIIRVNLRNSDIPKTVGQKIWRFVNMKRHFRIKKKPFIEGVKKNFKREDYSVILVSVSHDLFVLDAAYTISRSWRIPLIVDLRDIKEQKPSGGAVIGVKALLIQVFFRSLEKSKLRLRNRILPKSEAVTTVSPFHVEQLSKYNDHVKLIYNGYDPDLFHPGNIHKADKFYIVYTGIVLGQDEQDPGLLFEAVNQLEQENVIDRNSFRIQFYTPVQYRSAIMSHDLFSMIEEYVDFFDFVDFHEVPQILSRSSIALILTNLANEKGPNGVLTTKFFDYLGAERPILCVRSDEGILEKAIHEANSGISARTTREAYLFILDCWNEWKEKGFTSVNVNHEFKGRFTRKAQAKQFVDLFEQIT